MSVSVLCISCTKKRSDEIVLDNSNPLAFAIDIEWAVIIDPYVTFRETHEWTSKDLGHGKKGEILQVIGYSYSSENEKWVKFENGFLPIKSVQVYSNRYQAAKVSKGIIEE